MQDIQLRSIIMSMAKQTAVSIVMLALCIFGIYTLNEKAGKILAIISAIALIPAFISRWRIEKGRFNDLK